jgi:hypothetical protein
MRGRQVVNRTRIIQKTSKPRGTNTGCKGLISSAGVGHGHADAKKGARATDLHRRGRVAAMLDVRLPLR